MNNADIANELKKLNTKMDTVVAQGFDQDKRITILENFKKMVAWFCITIFTVFIGIGAKTLFDYKLVKNETVARYTTP